MVKATALSDKANQRAIRRLCEAHPGMQLILAHAARGFNMYHTISGLPALKGLRNVWFDSSAVCEPGALLAIIRTFGPERLLYGSDFPVTHIRGKAVTLGDSFLWLGADSARLEAAYAEGGRVRPTLVGIESLRALKAACDAARLPASSVCDIFYGNAARMFGLPPLPPGSECEPEALSDRDAAAGTCQPCEAG